MATPAEIALVTGSSRGIGLQIAITLARAGHAVALVARDAARLRGVAEDLQALGVRAAAVPADLLRPGSAAEVLAATRAALGEPTVLVNNAGAAATARFEATTDAMLDEMLALHVRVPLQLIRAVLPHMQRANRGRIVQIASTAGLRGFPWTAAYAAAKHAMVGLTRTLHAEIGGTGVRTCAVCPGYVDTDITRRAAAAVAARGRSTAEEVFARLAAQNRIGRMHTVAEVADAVLETVRGEPGGCVLDLDRTPPAWLD